MSCKVEIIDGEVVPVESNTPANAGALISATGTSISAYDEPDDKPIKGLPVPTRTKTTYPASTTPTTKKDNTTKVKSVPRVPITKIDYNLQLSPNYKLKDLTSNCVFKHLLRSQKGLSLTDLVHNLKLVAINILEPLRSKYPGFRINSGFRQGNGRSQHCTGQAVDLQWPGKPASYYSTVAAWAVNNLPYDQFILEHGNSIWLHFSHKSSGNRSQELTMKNNRYVSGLVNYYDKGKRIL
jgi:hypothetical protein